MNKSTSLFLIVLILCGFSSCKKDDPVVNLISTDNTLVVLDETDY